MGIRQFRPMTPATRFRSVSDFSEITKTEPEKTLLEPLRRTGGRNNKGHITSRYMSGGHKRQYRRIDFLRGERELLAAEVDAPVLTLVAAAHIPARDVALVVAPAGPLERLEQRFLGLRLRDVGEVGDRAKARGRCHRPKLSDAHVSPRTPRWRRPL